MGIYPGYVGGVLREVAEEGAEEELHAKCGCETLVGSRIGDWEREDVQSLQM